VSERLFDSEADQVAEAVAADAPLAVRMRPRSLDELVGSVATITPDEVQAVVDDVARIQPAWAELTLKDRAAYLRRAAVNASLDLLRSRTRAAAVPLDDATLATCDAALIITDHRAVDYARVVAGAPLVVDTRNATARVVAGREKIVKA